MKLPEIGFEVIAARPITGKTRLSGILIVSWSRPYQEKAYALYDMEKHMRGEDAFVRRDDGVVRVFETRSGARGVRSRLRHQRAKQLGASVIAQHQSTPSLDAEICIEILPITTIPSSAEPCGEACLCEVCLATHTRSVGDLPYVVCDRIKC